MENTNPNLNDLHRRYLANALSDEETALFFSLIREPGNEAILKDLMDAHWDAQFDGIEYAPSKTKVFRIWFRMAAAAVVLLVLSGVIYHLVQKPAPPRQLSQAERFKNEVQPGGSTAILKLADGSVIKLDSATNGQLAIQGQQQITNKDGALYYKKIDDGNSEVLYNDVITPAGGQYKLTLADGTKVWLDALSSIHYPTSFSGTTREVVITGQVYFEVTKNPVKSFKVYFSSPPAGGGGREGAVEVLGTHFNINAYDEAGIKTTLAEGSVRVVQKNKTLVLQPGQQAVGDKQGSLQLVLQPDMQETLAWKDGLIYYNGADIETIMKGISRWYGVEVVFKDPIKEKFVVDIPRTVPLSTVLSLLELTQQVHFKIDNKTITVMQ